MAGRKMFATRIDSELQKALKHLSVDTEKNISDLTEEAIRLLLEKHKKKDRK
jgi:predicted transcriptional regulator